MSPQGHSISSFLQGHQVQGVTTEARHRDHQKEMGPAEHLNGPGSGLSLLEAADKNLCLMSPLLTDLLRPETESPAKTARFLTYEL